MRVVKVSGLGYNNVCKGSELRVFVWSASGRTMLQCVSPYSGLLLPSHFPQGNIACMMFFWSGPALLVPCTCFFRIFFQLGVFWH